LSEPGPSDIELDEVPHIAGDRVLPKHAAPVVCLLGKKRKKAASGEAAFLY
jgi:hypothetical protein